MKIRTYHILFAILLFIFEKSHSKSGLDSLKFGVGAYVETFFTYDFNEPQNGKRQAFLVNHNRHNEVNINLALIQLSMRSKRVRAVVELQAGTYAEDNYAREEDLLKNIYQSYVGIALDKRSRWWLDMGIYLSHLSFESLKSLENPTLTRLVITENIPYYLSGAKLTFSPKGKWSFMAGISNGWQQIRREPGNSSFYYATEIRYKGEKRIDGHWSTFFGNQGPDSASRFRFYSNIDLGFSLTENLNLIILYHHIFQQKPEGSGEYDQCNSAGFILNYLFNSQWSTAFRYEYYHDPEFIITNNPSPDPFLLNGLSLNFNYKPIPTVQASIEVRWFNSPNSIFPDGQGFMNDNLFFTLALAAQIGPKTFF